MTDKFESIDDIEKHILKRHEELDNQDKDYPHLIVNTIIRREELDYVMCRIKGITYEEYMKELCGVGNI